MKKRRSILSYRLRIALVMALFAIVPILAMSSGFVAAEQAKWENTALSQYLQILDSNKEHMDRGFREMESKILYVKNDYDIRTRLNRVEHLTLVEKLDLLFAMREAENAIKVNNDTISLRWYSPEITDAFGGYCYPMMNLAEFYGADPTRLKLIDQLENNETLTLIREPDTPQDQYQVCVYTKIINPSGPDHILEMTAPRDGLLAHTQPALLNHCFLGAQLEVNGKTQTILLYGEQKKALVAIEEFYATGVCADYYPLEAAITEFPNSSIICLLEADYVSELFRGSILKLTGFFALVIIMVLVGSYVTSWLLTRKVYQFIDRVDHELGDGVAIKNDQQRAEKDFLDIEERVRELALCSREYGKQLEAYEVEKKQMELELLQMRFNPHFLYNTLGSIRYQVKEQRIRKSIDSLITYYRIVLSKGSLLISIDSEIQMIREYLNLETFAFDLQNVQYIYEIDDDVRGLLIVKHLLQPIVENALEHGVRSSESGASITIRARLQGENVVLEVEDTGIGMTPEQISTITTKPSGNPLSGGYGVYNVIQRIKAYYGPAYGVEFSSKPGKGTLVTITIPQMKASDQPKS